MLGWNQDTKIEYRLFDITQIITILVLFFWSIYSLIAGYTQIIKLIYFIALFFYVSVYFLYRKKGAFNVASILYYSFALLMLALAWLPSGGISGMVMHMFFLIFISGLLVLPVRFFVGFISASLLIVVINIYFEFTTPGLAAPYANEIDRVKDLSISGIIGSVVMAFCLYAFKKAHLNDREALRNTIDELEEEKERALAADKAKSDFLAIISHEMRTPLNGIVGITELLEDTELSSDQDHLLAGLSYSSELLHGLISDVLDMSAIESGELVLHESDFNVEEDITKLLEIVKPKLEEKDGMVTLNVNFDPAIPNRLVADSLRLRQVLLNLINNSIKFTESGFVEVSVELVEEKNEVFYLKFSVLDSGSGISKEDQNKLFSKFFKANVDSNKEGTGLGLSISQSLVKLMGGELQFTSNLNEGSAFYFEIPLKAHHQTDTIEDGSDLKQLPLKEISILIAEDVIVNQVVVKSFLENIGFSNVVITSNGKEALEMVKQQWFDIILMDIQMPIMDGLESSKAITKLFSGKKKPVIIAVSANVLGADFKEYKEVGISDFLSKPITRDSLKDVLKKYV